MELDIIKMILTIAKTYKYCQKSNQSMWNNHYFKFKPNSTKFHLDGMML